MAAAAASITASLEHLRIRGGDDAVGDDSDARSTARNAEEEARGKSASGDSRSACSVARGPPSSPPPSSSRPVPPPPPSILCDAWYGFPRQRRPRRERINAVARQVSNFLDWRASCNIGTCRPGCRVSLIGDEGDVGAVSHRMKELRNQGQLRQSTDSCDAAMDFESNVSIHEFLDRQQTASMGDVVYLSPDASIALSTDVPPPRTVIIGMLIDRRITEDRSRIRAETTLKLRAAKLPLGELNIKELISKEPLNVDTVMELMQRWWWNCDRLESQKEAIGDELQPNAYRTCFLEAAAWAMKTQRDRHPNRTIHMSNN
ncbi:hypothetical protein ACHAWF_000779 [Thalassiosira exigua]